MALGAFRAKRRFHAQVDAAALAIHHTMLEYADHPALGLGEPARRFTIDRRRREPGECLLLLCDEVLERRRHDGEPFGLDGIRGPLADAVDAATASTVRALEDAIAVASADPLQDDGTMVVFAPTSPQLR